MKCSFVYSLHFGCLRPEHPDDESNGSSYLYIFQEPLVAISEKKKKRKENLRVNEDGTLTKSIQKENIRARLQMVNHFFDVMDTILSESRNSCYKWIADGM